MKMKRRTEREKWVQTLIDSGMSFALYRMPHEEEVRLVLQLEGEARTLTEAETEPKGFVIAPFSESKQRQTLLIVPEVNVQGWESISLIIKELPQRPIRLQHLFFTHVESHYEEFFQKALHAIKEGRFQKVVAADKELGYGREHLLGQEARIFCQAVEGFPNSMVSLVYTPRSGRWMGISPEVLLEQTNGEWHTMALAGTKSDETLPWDIKNSMEQKAVSDYLADTLASLGISFRTEGPHTRRAGNLYHLCTDFRFSPTLSLPTMALARILHPTPAVCGLPKADAYRYICRQEQCERNYYSGYWGPVNTNDGTHLYVNLRCAQIRRTYTVYYAGGGLNQYSQYRHERQEIQHKISVLKRLSHD